MRPPPSLLELLQSAIERTYAMKTAVRDVEAFVVGDRGMRRLYAGRSIVERVGAAVSDARVLVRQADGQVFVNIYYPDELIAELERANPLHGLGRHNLDAFAVFVEELDHFLLLADRAYQGRRVSLFELELHANVTKFVTCRHFLRRSVGRPLSGDETAWLRWSLFEKHGPPHDPPDVHARYRDADRFADRYARQLERMGPRELLTELRAFHVLSGDRAVRHIRDRGRLEPGA